LTQGRSWLLGASAQRISWLWGRRRAKIAKNGLERILVGTKEDVLRALEYGKDPYYQAIRSVPSYQAELERVRKDYNERTWIDFKGFLPKFTTEEFERRRTAYQARHGNTINVPGFSDVIHIVPRARISAEERAAHIWAIKRKLPSPLTPDQIESLQYKKFRFLKALASATPTWMKNFGAVATVLDNVEDALVTISVLGRITASIAFRHWGSYIARFGWVLLGQDILNALNMFTFITMTAMKKKRITEDLAKRNPFHWKSKADRINRLRRILPTFGESLEILQTTDQLFGVGLCLGGFMGIVTDITAKTLETTDDDAWHRMPKTGNLDDFARWSYDVHASDQKKFKDGLMKMYTDFRDEAYRTKETDAKLLRDMFDYSKASSLIDPKRVKPPPGKFWIPFKDTLIGSMIMSTGKDDFLKEDHTKAFMMLDQAIRGLMPWWIENDPLEAFKDIRSFQFRAPEPTDPSTIDMLDDYDPNWRKTIKWPHLDKEYATIEEITFAYAPMIKDSFQTYCLKYSHEYEAMIAAGEVVEFVKDVIRSFSDDHEVVGGMTAWWAAAEDMAREIYLIPPDAPESAITSLADYIGNYERQTGVAPSIHDVARYGSSVGIEWMRTIPIRAIGAAAEMFPEWQAIQDQLEEIFVAD